MSTPPPNATLTTYRNPVLPGWNAHPSVCNVPGKGYFVATSSALSTPALPVYHSTDLFTWELVGHAIHDTYGGLNGLDYRTKGAPSNHCAARNVGDCDGVCVRQSRHYDASEGGYWTPALRYFGGRWYVVVVHECKDELPRLLLTSTRDIFDTTSWSEPIDLPVFGRDPDLFFDASKAYLTFSDAKPGDERVYVCPINVEDGTLLAEPTLLYRGPHKGVRLLKCAGWYYLLVDGDITDEDDVRDGLDGVLSSTPGADLAACTRMYRSKKHPASGAFLEAYETAPHNPVLYNGDHPEVRGTSRLNLVRGERGWSAIFHGTRGELVYPSSASPVGNVPKFFPTTLGKETYMASATWVNGWPLVNSGNSIGVVSDAEGMRWLPEVHEFEDAFDGDISYAWSTRNAVLDTSDKLVLRQGVHTEDAQLLIRQPGLSLDFEIDVDAGAVAADTRYLLKIRAGEHWASITVAGNTVEHEVHAPRLGVKAQRTWELPPATSGLVRTLVLRCRPHYYQLSVRAQDAARMDDEVGNVPERASRDSTTASGAPFTLPGGALTGVGAQISFGCRGSTDSQGAVRLLRARWRRVEAGDELEADAGAEQFTPVLAA